MGVTGSFVRVSGEPVSEMAKDTKPGKLKVGVLAGTGEHPGSRHGQTTAQVGWWNEFGAPGSKPPTPARPFLRPTMAENRKEYFKLMAAFLRQMMLGKMSNNQALGLLGFKVQSDIQTKIRTLKSPANADSTIARKKGKSNPLIDTGNLAQSIHWEKV
jgi:hypothetical protein